MHIMIIILFTDNTYPKNLLSLSCRNSKINDAVIASKKVTTIPFVTKKFGRQSRQAIVKLKKYNMQYVLHEEFIS